MSPRLKTLRWVGEPLDYMERWYIDYCDKSGDLCHVWVEACGKEDAIQTAKSEYWDIDRIIQVHK